jgi:hypothetical protein
MRKITLVLAVVMVLVMGVVFTGCIRIDRFADEGNRISKLYDETGFKNIEIGSAFQLDVIPMDTYSVNITAGSKFLDKLDVHLRGDTLVIRVTGWTFTFNESPRAVITMPELTGLDISGATSAAALGFSTTKPFDLKLSGASNCNVDLVTGALRAQASGASRIEGSITATATDLELSGASSCNIDGHGGDIKLEVSGASRAELRDYPVGNVDADLSGASTAYVDTNGRLDATISGASRLTYAGDPTIGSIDTSGGSSIRSE